MSQEKKKKPLLKPELKKVPLASDEAVLASCKLSTRGGGPGGAMGRCNNSVMGVVSPCSTYGS